MSINAAEFLNENHNISGNHTQEPFTFLFILSQNLTLTEMGALKFVVTLYALGLAATDLIAYGSAESPISGTVLPPITLGECNTNECKEIGDCNFYYVCSDGKWELKQCGSYLFWNPEVQNGFGGSCDYFNNLNKTQQETYVNNPDCIPPCDWWQTEEEKCTGTFHYRAPFNRFDPKPSSVRESTHSCPNGTADNTEQGLIWNPQALTCDRRYNVAGC